MSGFEQSNESNEFEKIYESNFMNNKEKINYFKEKVTNGSEEAIRYLGHLFNLEKDYTNMIKCYLKGVELGSIEYMNRLGNYYRNKKDYVNMKKYYKMAINKNCTSAMSNLATHYFEDLNDFDSALKYYLQSISLGNLKSMDNLGNIYREKKDIVNMKKYYNMAAEKNYTDSILNLMNYYKEKNDEENFIKYGELGVSFSNPEIIYELGNYYYRKRDITNAIKYFEISANLGNMKGISGMIGISYNEGDKEKMDVYMEKSVELKDFTCLEHYITILFIKNDYYRTLKYLSNIEDIETKKGTTFLFGLINLSVLKNKLDLKYLQSNSTNIYCKIILTISYICSYQLTQAYKNLLEIKDYIKNLNTDSEDIQIKYNSVITKIVDEFFINLDEYIKSNNLELIQVESTIKKSCKIVLESGATMNLIPEINDFGFKMNCCDNIFNLQLLIAEECPYCSKKLSKFNYDP